MNMNYKQENVIDYKGKSISKKNAKKFIINKQPVWFEKGVTCFELEDPVDNNKKKWVHILSPSIAYFVDENRWEWKNKLMYYNTPLVYGIYNYKSDEGYFTYDYKTTVLLRVHLHTKPKFCISKEVALQLGYDEFYHDGYFYNRSNLSITDIEYLRNNRINKNSFQYFDNDVVNATQNQYYNATKSNLFKKVINTYNNTLDESTAEDKLLASFIPYSLGLEFETSNGNIPERSIYGLGLIPLKDGSITNYEYTTIPLQGSKGINSIRKICEELTNRCTMDYKCSFHLHLGGLNYTAENTIASYKLFYYLQDELLSLFPLYKTEDYKITEKNYCKKLNAFPNLFQDNKSTLDKFNTVLGFLNSFKPYCNVLNSDAKVFNLDQETINNLNHLIDPDNNAKWNVYSRYFLVNLNPFVYGPRTIENRLHTPTFNQTKILSWILINTAILNYIDLNSKLLIEAKEDFEITLNDVITEGFSKNEHPCKNELIKYLISYLDFRKGEMKLASNKMDIYAQEIEKDKPFRFDTNNMFDLIINKNSYVTT